MYSSSDPSASEAAVSIPSPFNSLGSGFATGFGAAFATGFGAGAGAGSPPPNSSLESLPMGLPIDFVIFMQPDQRIHQELSCSFS